MNSIMDKLYNRVLEKGVVCVGLDTSLEYIPSFIKEGKNNEDAIVEFNKKIIDATIDVAACFKVQIAYYEALGIEGLLAYKRTLEYLRERDAIIIADIKRGDIQATATQYAKAHFEGDFEADFITINPYMGRDSITPYLKYIEEKDKGIFVLLRTSNPGAKDIQYLETKDGEHLYYRVGDMINDLASKYIRSCGYSPIGIVVGGTHIDEAKEIRDRYKNMFFLIPGYGHQGGKGKDVALYLNKGNGGVVNSSRGIITAYKKYDDGEENFHKYARKAVLTMREDIGNEKGL